jgi:hypothetical protein
MALNLGTVYAQANLDTSRFRSGVSEVRGLVGTLNASLRTIGDVAIGVSLARGIERIVSELSKIPKALIDVNRDMESLTASMTAALDNAALQTAQSWEEALEDIEKNSRSAFQRVARIQRDFEHLQEDFERKNTDLDRREAQTVEDSARRRQRATEDQIQSMSRLETRNVDMIEDFQRSMSDYTEQWGLQAEQRAATFNRQMEGLQAHHQDTIQKLQVSLGNLFEDQSEEFEKQAEGVANRLEDVERKFQRTTEDIGRQQAQASTSYAESMRGVSTQATRIAEEHAQKLVQILRRTAQQMSALRDAEEQQNLDFAQRSAQLRQEAEFGPTAEGRKRSAEELQRLQTQEGLRQVQAQRRREQIRQQAAAERAEATATAAQQNAALQNQANQARNQFSQRQADLAGKLRQETEDYVRQTERIQTEYNRQQRHAERMFDRKYRELQTSLARETREYQRQTEDLREKYTLDERIAAQAFRRREENNRVGLERQARDFQDHLENLQTTYSRMFEDTDREETRQLGDILRDREDALIMFNRRRFEMEEDYGNAVLKYQQDYTEGMQRWLAQTPETIRMFTAPWVAQANAIQENRGLLTRFTETAVDDTIGRTEQLRQYALEQARILPGSFRDIFGAMQRLVATGVDPVEGGMTRIVTALSTLPQVTRGVRQVADAFGALATGQMGEAVLRFREFGINLRTIRGLKFNSQGELTTPIIEAMEILRRELGPRSENILKRFEGTGRVVFSNLEDVFDQFALAAGKPFYDKLVEGVGRFITWFVENQPVVARVAEAFGKGLDIAIQALIRLVETVGAPENMDAIVAFTTNISTAFGAAIENIANFFGWLAQPEVLSAIGDFLNELGHLKDETFTLMGQFTEALVGRTDDEGGGPVQRFAKGMREMRDWIKVAADYIRENWIDTNLGGQMAQAIIDFSKETTKFVQDPETRAFIAQLTKMAENFNKLAQFIGETIGKLNELSDNIGKNELLKRFIESVMRTPPVLGIRAGAWLAGEIPETPERARRAFETQEYNEWLARERTRERLAAQAGMSPEERRRIFGENIAREMEAQQAQAAREEAARPRGTVLRSTLPQAPGLDVGRAREQREQEIGAAGTRALRSQVNREELRRIIYDAVQGEDLESTRQWLRRFGVELGDGLEFVAEEGSAGFERLIPRISEILDEIYGHSIVEDWAARLRSGLTDLMGGAAEAGATAFRALGRAIQFDLGGNLQQVEQTIDDLRGWMHRPGYSDRPEGHWETYQTQDPRGTYLTRRGGLLSVSTPQSLGRAAPPNPNRIAWPTYQDTLRARNIFERGMGPQDPIARAAIAENLARQEQYWTERFEQDFNAPPPAFHPQVDFDRYANWQMNAATHANRQFGLGDAYQRYYWQRRQENPYAGALSTRVMGEGGGGMTISRDPLATFEQFLQQFMGREAFPQEDPEINKLYETLDDFQRALRIATNPQFVDQANVARFLPGAMDPEEIARIDAARRTQREAYQTDLRRRQDIAAGRTVPPLLEQFGRNRADASRRARDIYFEDLRGEAIPEDIQAMNEYNQWYWGSAARSQRSRERLYQEIGPQETRELEEMRRQAQFIQSPEGRQRLGNFPTTGFDELDLIDPFLKYTQFVRLMRGQPVGADIRDPFQTTRGGWQEMLTGATNIPPWMVGDDVEAARKRVGEQGLPGGLPEGFPTGPEGKGLPVEIVGGDVPGGRAGRTPRGTPDNPLAARLVDDNGKLFPTEIGGGRPFYGDPRFAPPGTVPMGPPPDPRTGKPPIGGVFYSQPIFRNAMEGVGTSIGRAIGTAFREEMGGGEEGGGLEPGVSEPEGGTDPEQIARDLAAYQKRKKMPGQGYGYAPGTALGEAFTAGGGGGTNPHIEASGFLEVRRTMAAPAETPMYQLAEHQEAQRRRTAELRGQMGSDAWGGGEDAGGEEPGVEVNIGELHVDRNDADFLGRFVGATRQLLGGRA